MGYVVVPSFPLFCLYPTFAPLFQGHIPTVAWPYVFGAFRFNRLRFMRLFFNGPLSLWIHRSLCPCKSGALHLNANCFAKHLLDTPILSNCYTAVLYAPYMNAYVVSVWTLGAGSIHHSTCKPYRYVKASTLE